MKDVAALAGVSPKTVSNVTNETAFVRPNTREKVLAAVEELGFVPNLSARSLCNGRTGAIAPASIIVHDDQLPPVVTGFDDVDRRALRAPWRSRTSWSSGRALRGSSGEAI